MPAAKAPKHCDRCDQLARRLYRIASDGTRHDHPSKPWQLVCEDCWPTFKAQPGYTYGGTWTDRKRK